MNKYTIYCTEEQTKKALELGAPIEKVGISQRDTSRPVLYTDDPNENLECNAYYKPTAEQMLGWLRNRKINIDISYEDIWELYTVSLNYGIKDKWNLLIEENREKTFNTFEEATLAAIDAALNYLI